VLTLLTPSVVKFIHVFNHHKHDICKGEYQTHLHASDFDCSYHKFKLTTPFTIPLFSVGLFIPEHSHKTSDSKYFFLSEYQRLHVSLRGPPQLNLI
jgi:hypothetical protein